MWDPGTDARTGRCSPTNSFACAGPNTVGVCSDGDVPHSNYKLPYPVLRDWEGSVRRSIASGLPAMLGQGRLWSTRVYERYVKATAP